jgi:hypothetical protein
MLFHSAAVDVGHPMLSASATRGFVSSSIGIILSAKTENTVRFRLNARGKLTPPERAQTRRIFTYFNFSRIFDDRIIRVESFATEGEARSLHSREIRRIAAERCCCAALSLH